MDDGRCRDFDWLEIFQGAVLRWTGLLVGCALAHCRGHGVSAARICVMGVTECGCRRTIVPCIISTFLQDIPYCYPFARPMNH